MGNTFVPDMKNLAGLCPGGDLQFFITIEGRHFDLGAECRLGNIDVQVQQNIVLAALEELMRCDIQDQEEASIWSPVGTGSALACQTDLCPTVHTSRNLHFLGDRLSLQATAMTGFTGRRDRFAATITGRTGRG